MLSKEDYQRYSRQIIIPEFGEAGQVRLKQSSALVIGAGGLGAPILQYLTAAGVGHIGIVEFDVVSLSNLQRQILYDSNQLGDSKAHKSVERLSRLNPSVNFTLFEEAITTQNAEQCIEAFDLVVDGSDNLATRYLVNDTCYFLNKPLIYGAIFRFEGQVSVFNLEMEGDRGPNYRDLFPTPPPPEMVPSCSEGGVLGALPGIIGSMMASEAIKVLAQIGTTLSGRLFVFDALDFSSYTLKVNKNLSNPISGDNATITELIDYEVFCSREIQNTTLRQITVQEFEKKLKNENVFLLDVREDYEYEIANLGGTLIPLNKVTSRLDEIPKDKEVIVICKMGSRSAKAIELLQEQGFNNLVNLKGGIMAWQKEIDPTMNAY